MNEENKSIDQMVEEYITLLDQLGFHDDDISDFKNREHRRFNFDTPERTIILQIDDQVCALNDVSISGLSFIAPVQYDTGRNVTVNFDGRYEVEVEVVSSRVDDTMESDTMTYYRHGAQFVSENDGYRCTIVVLRYYMEIMKSHF